MQRPATIDIKVRKLPEEVQKYISQLEDDSRVLEHLFDFDAGIERRFLYTIGRSFLRMLTCDVVSSHENIQENIIYMEDFYVRLYDTLNYTQNRYPKIASKDAQPSFFTRDCVVK